MRNFFIVSCMTVIGQVCINWKISLQMGFKLLCCLDLQGSGCWYIICILFTWM